MPRMPRDAASALPKPERLARLQAPRPSGPRTAHAPRQTHLTDQFFRTSRLSDDCAARSTQTPRDRRPRAIAGCRAAIHRRAWFRTRWVGLAPFRGAPEASFVVSARRAILKNHDNFVCESEGPEKTRRSVIWPGRTPTEGRPLRVRTQTSTARPHRLRHRSRDWPLATHGHAAKAEPKHHRPTADAMTGPGCRPLRALEPPSLI
jgi:hypothetical protein